MTYTQFTLDAILPHLSPTAVTVELIPNATDSGKASVGYIGSEFTSAFDIAPLPLLPDGGDFSYTNSLLTTNRGTQPFMDDNARAIHECFASEPVLGELFDYAPELLESFIKTLSKTDLPKGPVVRDEVLDCMRPLAVKLVNSHAMHILYAQGLPSLEIDSRDLSVRSHFVEALRCAFESFRDAISLCMAAPDPSRYARFLSQGGIEPLAFLQLAPLFAEGLKSASRMHTPEILHGIWQDIFTLKKNGITEQANIDQLMFLITIGMTMAGLDSNDYENKKWAYCSAIRLSRDNDEMKSLLYRRVCNEAPRAQYDPDIKELMESGKMNMYAPGLQRFYRAFGICPMELGEESALIPFHDLFCVGPYPFAIHAFAIRANEAKWISSFSGREVNEGGQTVMLTINGELKISMIFLTDPSPSTLHHELWHAFEHSIFDLGSRPNADASQDAQKEWACREFRAIMAPMAFFDGDDENKKVLLRQRSLRSRDAIWNAANVNIVKAFEGIDENDAPGIRARAREQINNAYKELFGMTVDELFDPFRRLAAG